MSKLDKSKFSNDEHPKNINCISTADCVLKFLRFKYDKNLQFANILSMYKTFEESKLDKSKDNKEEQPENIFDKFITDNSVNFGKVKEDNILQP